MDPIKELKIKVIDEFLRFMEATNLGLSYRYDGIIDKISFIEYANEIENSEFIYQYLINK